VTAGAGHRRAAEALAHAAQAHDPQADVACVNLLDHTPSWFRRGYGWIYLLLVRHLSWLWKLNYRVLDHPVGYRSIQPLRRAWNLLMTRRFVRWLRAQEPTVVVATHFLPADVCSACKQQGWLTAPLIVVVTDWHPHRFWLSQEAQAIVVGTRESAAACERWGLARERLHVFGIPIDPAFGAAVNRQGLAERFQLHATRRTVLVTSGGTTVGRFERVVEALLALEWVRPGLLQLLVVCGENETLRRRLTECAKRSAMPLRAFGFVDYMADLMAVSDLAVAKAGGLTVSEALGRGLPMVFYHVIPGQEQMNALYVVRHGAAVIAQTPRETAVAAQRCLSDPALLTSMQEAAKALGHPDAASAIVSRVIGPLLQNNNPSSVVQRPSERGRHHE